MAIKTFLRVFLESSEVFYLSMNHYLSIINSDNECNEIPRLVIDIAFNALYKNMNTA